MARRSGWRRLVLALMLMLVALPAMAGGVPSGKGREAQGITAVWRTVVRWVVPSRWLAKLGPGMDPDGLTGGTALPVRGGDLGPDMDPNG